MSLFIKGVKVQAASVITLSYAPPQVSGVSASNPTDLNPPATSVDPTNLNTAGNEMFYLTGTSLGQVCLSARHPRDNSRC